MLQTLVQCWQFMSHKSEFVSDAKLESEAIPVGNAVLGKLF
jgi:hypothetical protein